MPRRHARHICVPESILLSSGGIETVLLDERYTPYTSQRARIENLCGSFTERVSGAGLDGVLVKTNTCFGRQRELFHLCGNVTVNREKGSFMGARGLAGLERLASVLQLSSAGNAVHMVVLCSKLGKRVQVTAGGLLETSILEQAGQKVRIGARHFDHTNTVRFTVQKFEGPVFEMPDALHPENNDWTITGKGTVMIRLTWKHMEWTAAAEEACLALSNRVTAWLRTCC